MPGPAGFTVPVLSPWLTQARKSRPEFMNSMKSLFTIFPFHLFVFCFFKAISGGSVSARRVTQTDGHAITWLYNPINGPPDLLFMKTMEGNAATARRPSHQKQNITPKKKTSHQRWLQMQIKKSWKPVKPAGAFAQPPQLCLWGVWKACGQGQQVSPLNNNCGIRATPLQMWPSLKAWRK